MTMWEEEENEQQLKLRQIKDYNLNENKKNIFNRKYIMNYQKMKIYSMKINKKKSSPKVKNPS